MKHKTAISIFASVMAILDTAYCQGGSGFPFLRDVLVKARVSKSANDGMLFYSYALRNGTSSDGGIQEFDLDISRPLNSALLDTNGLRFKGTFSEEHFRSRYSELGQMIIPVSAPSLPQYWLALFGNDLMISIGKDTLFVKPGQGVDSLLLMSKGIPSIRGFLVRPYFNVFQLLPSLEDTSGTMTKSQMDSIREVVNFQGLTIGPSAPPLSLNPGAFLDTLVSYSARSHLLGWIMNHETAEKYTEFFVSTRAQLQSNNVGGARTTLQQVLHDVDIDSSSTLTSEAYALLRYNTEYLLDHLPAGSVVSSYSLFATHSLWLEQNSDVFSGDIGVNEAGAAPFLDSQVELSVGIGTSTASGYSVKANHLKVKQGSTVGSDVFYNELENNGTITGTLHTPLTLPLISSLLEFKQASPGSQNITVPQNGTQTLQPGSYGDILVRRSGKLTFTGGTYHLASLSTGDNVQLVFQAPSEIRIDGKFDTDQGTYVGPEDTTSLSANQIVFYIAGINGSNGNLGATPKAAQIGIANTTKANFYVPNGTLWIRQNGQATGAFIGKDINVGIGVKIWLKSAF